MDTANKTTFIVRPGYGSKIEMIELSENDPKRFLEKLKPIIKDINAKTTSKIDLWQNEEHILQFRSDIGAFSVSFGIYGFIFIESGIVFNKNSRSNIVIHKLAEVMSNHNFEQRTLTDAELNKYKAHKKSNM